MYIKSKKRYLGAMITGFIAAVLLMLPGWVPDAMAESRSSDESEIMYTGEQPVHPGYPRIFDFVGPLDRIARKEAVLGDTLYPISPSASFHMPGGRFVSRSRLRVGDTVGCLTNSEGEIESLWFISRKKR